MSTYTLRLSSPRITPSNSLSDVEWDNETRYNRYVFCFFLYEGQQNVLYLFFQRKTALKCSPKKTKYIIVAIAAGLTIAIVIAIGILVPSISTSKSSATENNGATSSEF